MAIAVVLHDVPNSTALAADKPDILVIMADDVGWMNVASYGGDMMGVKTPNIDCIQSQILKLKPNH